MTITRLNSSAPAHLHRPMASQPAPARPSLRPVTDGFDKNSKAAGALSGPKVRNGEIRVQDAVVGKIDEAGNYAINTGGLQLSGNILEFILSAVLEQATKGSVGAPLSDASPGDVVEFGGEAYDVTQVGTHSADRPAGATRAHGHQAASEESSVTRQADEPGPVAPPLANTRVAQELDASVLMAIPEDLRAGTRNGVPVIRVASKADVERVPAAVWQFIADRGVYLQSSTNSSLSQMSASDVKQTVLQGLDSPNGRTNYYLGVAIEQLPWDQRAKPPTGSTAAPNDRGVSQWYDAQVLQAMQDASKTGAVTKAQFAGLAQQYNVPPEQFERVYARFANPASS